MQTHRQYFFHFIWATKWRQPFITEKVEPRLNHYIRRKCSELNVHVYAINGMPDHVHIACSLPSTISTGAFIKAIKGGSAHFVNHLPDVKANAGRCLYWQPGYWGMTYAETDLPRLVGYIDSKSAITPKGRSLTNWNTCPQSRRDFPSRKNSPAFPMPGL